MNRKELVEAVAAKAGTTQAEADRVLEAFQTVVFDAVAKGKDVITWTGFLKFEQVKRAARTGRNPATGATIQIAAGKAVKVTAGSKLKAAASGK